MADEPRNIKLVVVGDGAVGTQIRVSFERAALSLFLPAHVLRAPRWP